MQGGVQGGLSSDAAMTVTLLSPRAVCSQMVLQRVSEFGQELDASIPALICHWMQAVRARGWVGLRGVC